MISPDSQRMTRPSSQRNILVIKSPSPQHLETSTGTVCRLHSSLSRSMSSSDGISGERYASEMRRTRYFYNPL